MRGEGEICAYCHRMLEATTSHGGLAATRDHVHPRSRGGSEQVWACRLCNQLKGGKTAESWARFMNANPRWWERPEFASYAYRDQSKHSKRKLRRAYYKAVAKSDDEVLAVLADGGPNKVVLGRLSVIQKSRKPTAAERVLSSVGLLAPVESAWNEDGDETNCPLTD